MVRVVGRGRHGGQLAHLGGPDGAVAHPYGDDVEQIAREIEIGAAKAGLVASNEGFGENERMVDAILVSSSVTDHMHEASLRQFDRRIPVVAGPDAAVILKGWDYFETVVALKDLGGDNGSKWQGLHPKGPVPGWLTLFRLRESALNFAIVIVWSRGVNGEVAESAGAGNSSRHEALWVSPHGMHLDQPRLQAFLRDSTETIDVLAMLHPLKESFTWGWQTVLGVTGGLAVERALGGPKYWVSTANAALSYWGLVMLRVQDVPRTMEWGLAEEGRIAQEKGEAVVQRRPNPVEVTSGESLVLK